MDVTSAQLLRQLPSVNECLARLSENPTLDTIPYGRLKHCVRLFLTKTRQYIVSGQYSTAITPASPQWYEQLATFIGEYHHPHFRRVINATGVIVHTNLGRSLLPDSALAVLHATATFASNLELDLGTGRRGSRYSHVEALRCALTGAESALVVNNNAAAVLIALETL